MKKISVVAILHDPYTDKVLLGMNNAKAGWEFAGGKQDGDESLLMGVCRELYEETNISLLPGQFRFIGYIDEEPGWMAMLFFAEVKHEHHQPKRMEPHKHAQWGWFSCKQLPSPLSYAAQLVLQKFFQHWLEPDRNSYEVATRAG